jgi:YggT family protein
MEARILIIQALIWFRNILDALIFIRVVLSWLPIDRNNPLVAFVYNMTEPILAPIRNLIFKSPMGGSGMMIDFSPAIAFILIQAVIAVLIQMIARI